MREAEGGRGVGRGRRVLQAARHAHRRVVRVHLSEGHVVRRQAERALVDGGERGGGHVAPERAWLGLGLG